MHHQNLRILISTRFTTALNDRALYLHSTTEMDVSLCLILLSLGLDCERFCWKISRRRFLDMPFDKSHIHTRLLKNMLWNYSVSWKMDPSNLGRPLSRKVWKRKWYSKVRSRSDDGNLHFGQLLCLNNEWFIDNEDDSKPQ